MPRIGRTRPKQEEDCNRENMDDDESQSLEEQMKTNLILINNDIVDAEEINIHPFNRGHQFGDGVFELIPVYNGKALNLEMHLEHLFESMIRIRIPAVYMVEEMMDCARRFIAAADIQNGLINTQVTRGIGPFELDFPEQCEPELIMQAVPLDRQELAKKREEGVSLLTVPDERGIRCDLNVLNRLPEIMAKHTARVGRCYDALFIREDKVTEATEASFMLVKDEMLWTFPLKAGAIHENITRKLIKEKLAANLDMQVIEKAFTKDFALGAEEAFLCGPRCEILPVVKIDRRPVGEGRPGKMTLALQGLLDDFILEQTR